MDISVIIPVYNAARPLRRALEALARSTLRPLETIVVDDGSQDSTAAVAREFGCRMVSLSGNRGPATARNKGAAVARGAILFFLDSDTAVFPDTLALAMQRLVRSSADAVVGVYAKEPLNSGFFPRYYCLLKHASHQVACDRYTVFASQCAAIRREVFEAVGGFAPMGPGVDVENEELGRRVAARGRIVLDPEVQVAHEFKTGWPLAQALYRRSLWWTRYFKQHRTFEAALTTRRLAAATVVGPVGIAMLLAAAFLPAGAAAGCAGAGLAALGLFGYGYGPFLRFSAREAGWWFAARAAAASLGLSAVILAGAVVGMIPTPSAVRGLVEGPLARSAAKAMAAS